MSELKFKVGDKVKVTTRRSGQFGKEATIMDCEGISYPYGVQFSVGCERLNYFKRDELELVSEDKNDEIEKVDNKLKFKVGDRVRVLNSTIFSYRKNGEVGTIIKAYYSEPTYDVKFETADEEGDYELMLNQDELELVGEAKEATISNINELCEKPQQVLGNFESIAINTNQPLKDAFKELLNISEQLSEFNNKNNTKLRIIIE